MKSDAMGIGTPINQEHLKELLKETKETVAIYLKDDNANRVFGSIDMWNRQKRQRTTSQMRRWLN